MKRKTYSTQFKLETIQMRRDGVPIGEIMKKQGVTNSMVYRWEEKYGKNGHAKPNGRPGTDPDKIAQVQALIASGLTKKAAAKKVGVPIATVYGWKKLKKRNGKAHNGNGGQLVPYNGQPIQATPVQGTGINALVSAAEKALINLKQARRVKLENIQSHVPGAETFTDDFCHGQIAYNALARAFGMK